MRRKRLNRNWKPNRNINNSKKAKMLNMNALPYFKYDLKNLLEKAKMDDNVKNSFVATLWSKASRMSIPEAKDFVKDKCEEGIFDSDMEAKLLRLLDKYSKWR